MSDVQSETPAPAPAVQPESAGKKAQAEQVVADLLRLMGFPARLEVRDGPDGGISIAVFFEGEVPGAPAGKRSHLVDSLQFLANKIVNRPGADRRWISIGVGGHPEPRPPKGEKPAAVPAEQPRPPKPPPAKAQARRHPPPPRNGQPAMASRPAPQPEEATLQVSEDADLSRAARLLFEKSAALGRYYAVLGMKPEDRARLLKAVGGMSGATVRVEGEGRGRRVVFVPDKPAPAAKQAMPDDDEEEEEA